MNSRMLEEKISESGLKKGVIAKKMGLSRAGLWKKVTGQNSFTVTEAGELCKILGIDMQEKEQIFFA